MSTQKQHSRQMWQHSSVTMKLHHILINLVWTGLTLTSVWINILMNFFPPNRHLVANPGGENPRPSVADVLISAHVPSPVHGPTGEHVGSGAAHDSEISLIFSGISSCSAHLHPSENDRRGLTSCFVRFGLCPQRRLQEERDYCGSSCVMWPRVFSLTHFIHVSDAQSLLRHPGIHYDLYIFTQMTSCFLLENYRLGFIGQRSGKQTVNVKLLPLWQQYWQDSYSLKLEKQTNRRRISLVKRQWGNKGCCLSRVSSLQAVPPLTDHQRVGGAAWRYGVAWQNWTVQFTFKATNRSFFQ